MYHLTIQQGLIKNRQEQVGFTVVEVMVASLLGIILLSSILQISQSMVQNSRTNSMTLGLQAEGRYVIQQISSVIRQRGFQGCMSPVRKNHTNTDPIDWVDASYITAKALRWPTKNWSKATLRGFSVNASGTWEPDPDAGNAEFLFNTADVASLKTLSTPFSPPIEGSDVLSIQYTSAASILVDADMIDKTDDIIIENNALGLAPSNIIMVGNNTCDVADIIAISDVKPASGTAVRLEHSDLYNTSEAMTAIYRDQDGTGESSWVRQVFSRTFYVAETGRVSPDGTPINALYAYDLSPTASPTASGVDNHQVNELAAGVEAMRILYGVANDSGAIAYVPAPAEAADATSDFWQNVRSIQVAVLLRSIAMTASSAEDQQYQLLDRTYGSPSSSATFKHQGDNFLRKVFTTTIELKNRSM